MRTQYFQKKAGYIMGIGAVAVLLMLILLGVADSYPLHVQVSELWQDVVSLADGLIVQFQLNDDYANNHTHAQTWLATLNAAVQIEPQLAEHIAECLKRYVQIFVLVVQLRGCLGPENLKVFIR